MSVGYTVEAILKAVDKGFSATMRAAEKQVASFASSAEKGSARLATISDGMVNVGGAMTKYVTTPIVGGVVASVKAFADLEQAAGGVKTMLKDSASEVIKNSQKAYLQAGISGTQYMEQVTSFSASLLQSLGGDTKKAVEYADTAVKSMADNAAKFGTNIGDIQNAYQGFAKQNYTMLDNLKLGYGGTKGEMERLIADANRVKQANGEMADLSIESFADVVEAIQTIQEEMGVAGVAADEAKSTVTGSFNMMKAASMDFLAGLGDDTANMDQLFKNLEESVKAFGTNIQRVLGTIWKNLPFSDVAKQAIVAVAALGPLITGFGFVGKSMATVWGGAGKIAANFSKIPTQIASVKAALKAFGANLGNVFAPFTAAISRLAGKITPHLTGVKVLFSELAAHIMAPFTFLGAKLSGLLPPLAGLGSLFGSTFMGMGNILMTFSKVAMSALMPAAIFGVFLVGLGLLQSQFGEQINQMVQVAVMQGPTIITNFINGIVSKIPDLINQGVQLINQFTQVIVANAPAIFQGAVALISSLVQGVGNNAGQLIGSAVQIIGVLVNGLLTSLPQLLAVGMQFLVQLAQGAVQNIPLILSTAQTIFLNFVNAVVSNLPQIIQSGIQIIMTLAQGIIQNLPQIIQTAVTIIGALISGIARSIPQIIMAGFNLVIQLIAGIGQAFPQILEAGWQLISGFFGAIGKGIVEFGQGIVDGITGLWDMVTGKTSESTGKAKASVDDLVISTDTKLAGMATSAGTHSSIFATNVSTNFANANATAVAEAGAMAAGVNAATSQIDTQTLASLPTYFETVQANTQAANATATAQAAAMATGVNAQLSSIQTGAGAAMAGVSGDITNQMTAAATSATNSANQMSTAVTNSFNQMKASVTNALSSLASAMTTGMSNISSTVSTGGNKIQQIFNQTFERIKSLTSSTMSMLQAAFRNGMNQVVNVSQSSGNRVVAIFNAIQGQMVSAGANAGVGFGNGLAGQAGYIYSVANSIAANVAATIRRALSIHSPSRVTEELGEFTGEGLAEGIKSWIPKVGSISDALAMAAKPNINPLDVSTAFEQARSSLDTQFSLSGDFGKTINKPMEFVLNLGGTVYRAFTNNIAEARELELILDNY